MWGARYVEALLCAARLGSYVVPSRQIANRIPASLRARATAATGRLRRWAIWLAHSSIGCGLRASIAAHAPCTRQRLSSLGPALVIPVLPPRAQLECSPGVRPR